MHSPDFLHKDAETNLCEHYIAAGALCKLQTNSEQVLEAARDTFLPMRDTAREFDFAMRFWIDDTPRSRGLWPKPYVRGLDHLVFAGFDEGSSILANLHKRLVIGRFSQHVAADRAYYKHVIFPMILTIVGATVGIAELHSACVVNDEGGVMLAGPSGAGKSTLALALSQCGFGFVSDDRTFCVPRDNEVQVWGLPTLLKLRPQSVLWFPELQHSDTPNGIGNADAWFEAEQISAVTRRRHGRATSLIFLEREETPTFCISPMSRAEVLDRLTQEMMTELPQTVAKRSELLKRIAELPCWLLRYCGKPHQIAQRICAHIAGS